MSEKPEDFSKDLAVDTMINAVDNSVNENEEEHRPVFESQTPSLPIPQDSNTSISEILQKVAEIAASLREDLRNMHIGEYVVSMNVSPLEIQVKQAIESLQVVEVVEKINVTKDDDGEHRNATDIPIPLETTEVKNTSNQAQNLTPQSSIIQNDEIMDLEQNSISILKNSKRISFGKRFRRLFRFTLRRRRKDPENK